METLQNTFSPDMKMADLMNYDYRLLFVLSRFDIPLGFGEKTVEEVCTEHGIDPHSFLIMVDLFLYPERSGEDSKEKIKYIAPLLQYLQNSHLYFLEYRLPSIRRALEQALDAYKDPTLSNMFLHFFDEYANEVHDHMDYEDNVVFPYVRNLMDGKTSQDYTIQLFALRHNNIEEKLADLKNLIIKYIPPYKDSFQTNNILLDICTCEEDLHTHSFLEDEIFIPAIRTLEKQLTKTKGGKVNGK